MTTKQPISLKKAAKTKKRRHLTSVAQRRHEWAWQETFNAAVTGICSRVRLTSLREPGDETPRLVERSADLDVIVDDAKAIADRAHGPLVGKP